MAISAPSGEIRLRLYALILGWFFFSGVAALIYEVLWARQLELAFGSTLPAVSTILSVFMAGLALGSLYFGRLVDRWKNPLRLYALLEMGIGLYALLTPFIFQGLNQLQLYWGRYSATGISGFSPFNLLFSALVLLIPTTLMGGTLPVMTRFVTGRYEELGRRVGRLYFINTLGAAAGSVLAGFLLIALLGIFATTYVAAGINILIGLLALFLGRSWPLAAPTLGPAAEETLPVPPSAPSPWLVRFLLPLYGLAGFAALGLEVLLTRALVLVLGSSVYAFSLMLAAFLVGIALGSTLVARFIDERRDLWLWFALIEIGIGLAVLLLTVFLGKAPLLLLRVFLAYSQTFWALLLAEFLILFAAMLVPTLLMGAAFPIVSKLHAREMARLGRAVGQVYAANTFGSIIGPLVAGFFLIPLVGMQTGLMVTAFIYLAIGAVFLSLRPMARPLLRTTLASSMAAIIMLGVVLIPSWNKGLMSSGVYYHPRLFSSPNPLASLREFATRYRLIFYKEGQLGTVSVLEVPGGDLTLSINGKPEASTRSDLSTELLVGHVPVLLHPQPQKVLLVGLASGITLGAILRHPQVEAVDVMEIEPVVVEAAGYFSKFNYDAINDPRVRLIVGDARNRVLTSPQQYDVIVAEPSNPWVSGATTLFSRQMFELYKKRLNEGGIVSQWIHLYSINTADLKAMINTFVSVFPYTTIWQDFTHPDIQIVGSLRPITLDWANWGQRISQDSVKQDLERIASADPYVLLSYFQMDEASVRAFVVGSPINTDNYPRLEFSTPRYLYFLTFGTNMDSMLPFLASLTSLLKQGVEGVVLDRIATYEKFRNAVIQGMVYQEQGQWGPAVEQWEQAQKLVPQDTKVTGLLADGYEYLAVSYLRQGETQKAVDIYLKVVEIAPERASPLKSIASIAQASGMVDQALSYLLRASEIAPYDLNIYIDMGNLYQAKKEYGQAIALFSRVIELSQAFPWGYVGRGSAYRAQGDYEKAIADFTQAIRLSPKAPRYYLERGRAYAQKGDQARAILDISTALRLEPVLSEAYESRGIAYLKQGDYTRAVRDLSWAIGKTPSASLYDNRGLAYINQRQYGPALSDLDQATAMDSSYALPYYRRGYLYQVLGRQAEAIDNYEKFLSLSQDSGLRDMASSALEKLKTTQN